MWPSTRKQRIATGCPSLAIRTWMCRVGCRWDSIMGRACRIWRHMPPWCRAMDTVRVKWLSSRIRSRWMMGYSRMCRGRLAMPRCSAMTCKGLIIRLLWPMLSSSSKDHSLSWEVELSILDSHQSHSSNWKPSLMISNRCCLPSTHSLKISSRIVASKTRNYPNILHILTHLVMWR